MSLPVYFGTRPAVRRDPFSASTTAYYTQILSPKSDRLGNLVRGQSWLSLPKQGTPSVPPELNYDMCFVKGFITEIRVPEDNNRLTLHLLIYSPENQFLTVFRLRSLLNSERFSRVP